MYAYNGLLELFVLKILLPFSAYLLLCTVFQVFAKIAYLSHNRVGCSFIFNQEFWLHNAVTNFHLLTKKYSC